VSTPRVSVCVPVYRRPELVVEAVRSALAQSFSDLEVVVVDNASPDGTWEACQAVAREDDRVRVFRNDTNLGPVGNWERCLAEARGEFAKLLFSDDLLEPRYLEATVPVLAGDPQTGLVWTSTRIGPMPGAGELWYDWPGGTGPYSSAQFVEDLLFRHSLVSPGAALHRTEALRRYVATPAPGLVDWRATGAGPDLLSYLLAAAEHETVSYVAEPLVFFRHHAGSLTVDRREEVAEGYRQARVWFAAHHCAPAVYARMAARVWLSACGVARRPVRPGPLLARYGGRPAGMRLWWAVARELITYPWRGTRASG
jgi:glycosyltransferase involved in cell wall biosynthesis